LSDSYVITEDGGRIIALLGDEDDARQAAKVLSKRHCSATVHVRPRRADADVIARYVGGREAAP